MRSFVSITFYVAVILMSLHFRPALAASVAPMRFTPCAPVDQARMAARLSEVRLFDELRHWGYMISMTHFQNAIDRMDWDATLGEFVSEILGSNAGIGAGNVLLTVSCVYNQKADKLELQPLITFVSGN
jgi:hypothetical protein